MADAACRIMTFCDVGRKTGGCGVDDDDDDDEDEKTIGRSTTSEEQECSQPPKHAIRIAVRIIALDSSNHCSRLFVVTFELQNDEIIR